MENKVRIILFGAVKFVYEVSQTAINFDTTEIIAFSDNDERKWGISYEGLNIVSPEKLLELQFDYIIVGAWYSYMEIRERLLSLGVTETKIMPLLQKRHLRYLTETMEGLDQSGIKKIFVNGDMLIRDLEKLNQTNRLYKESKPFSQEETMKYTNFKEYPLIAHACGGYINGKKREYTNSLEALQAALDAGFDMIECDVWGIQEGNIILGSRLKMQYPVRIDYTLLSLDLLLKMIAEDVRKKVILDIKYNTMDDLYRLLSEIERLVCRLEKEERKNIKRQILVESFDEESTKYIKERNWECILTDYRSAEGTWLKKTAVICCQTGVKSVLIDASSAMKNAKYVKFLLDKNIDVICYTVDEIEDYVQLKKIGITSVLTNFLQPYSGIKH